MRDVSVDLPGACLRAGEIGSGTPVLVLHGGGLDRRHMIDAVEPVFEVESGWRRLYLDLPGHGQSKADESVATQDDVLELVFDFIDAAIGDEPFAVVGESRGSYLARGIVHKRPGQIAGMALIGPGGVTLEERARLPEHQVLVRDEVLRAELPPDEQERLDRLVVQSPAIMDKVRRTKMPANALVDGTLAERIAANFEFTFDLSAPDAPFDGPTLILCGRQDAIAGYEDGMAMLHLYRRATLAVLDRAGHAMSWEQPDLFIALMREWLRRVAEAASAD